ncbi:expressed protein [Phakopsora pachyrhizi]|uniref:Expressed protein n=1 Tax=Phakopsora pachyrhizi TaxID=170000 RepID=A0AAV0AMR0_PHAPC|nr:expressed protein [Phakopsora pachyrhizi]
MSLIVQIEYIVRHKFFANLNYQMGRVGDECNTWEPMENVKIRMPGRSSYKATKKARISAIKRTRSTSCNEGSDDEKKITTRMILRITIRVENRRAYTRIHFYLPSINITTSSSSTTIHNSEKQPPNDNNLQSESEIWKRRVGVIESLRSRISTRLKQEVDVDRFASSKVCWDSNQILDLDGSDVVIWTKPFKRVDSRRENNCSEQGECDDDDKNSELELTCLWLCLCRCGARKISFGGIDDPRGTQSRIGTSSSNETDIRPIFTTGAVFIPSYNSIFHNCYTIRQTHHWPLQTSSVEDFLDIRNLRRERAEEFLKNLRMFKPQLYERSEEVEDDEMDRSREFVLSEDMKSTSLGMITVLDRSLQREGIILKRIIYGRSVGIDIDGSHTFTESQELGSSVWLLEEIKERLSCQIRNTLSLLNNHSAFKI